jgi:hypothetical protein
MKRLLAVFVALTLILTGALLDSWLRPVHAQTTTAVEFSYVSVHASCAAVTSTTVFCFAADSGLWLSVNGTATFTQVGGSVTAGVTGITVCNATGSGCAAATVSSGVVTLNIPKSGIVAASTVTLQ